MKEKEEKNIHTAIAILSTVKIRSRRFGCCTWRTYATDADRFETFLGTPSATSRKTVKNRVFPSRLDVTNTDWITFSKELRPGAKMSLTIPNAGGTSVRSEALSIHVMEGVFAATNVLCEMQVHYDGHPWSMVDYLCTIRGRRIGVSVFRAMVGPSEKRTAFTYEDAERLVRKKLKGLIVARNSMASEHRFNKCILHVIAQSPHSGRMMIEALRAAMGTFEDELVAVVTVVRKFDDVFYEKKAGSCCVVV